MVKTKVIYTESYWLEKQIEPFQIHLSYKTDPKCY